MDEIIQIADLPNFWFDQKSSHNAIIHHLAFDAFFNNSLISLNRFYFKSRSSARIDQNERAKGSLLCSLLHICSDHCFTYIYI